VVISISNDPRPFIYEKLDPRLEEIRLFTLSHGNLEDQPRCHIEVVSLQSEPDFSAPVSPTFGEMRMIADVFFSGTIWSA
jgi:hypothetical protein